MDYAMHTFRLISLALILASLGCRDEVPVAEVPAQPPATLEGSYRVEQWQTSTGDFQRNHGWIFAFAGDKLEMTKHDGDIQIWDVIYDSSADPARMVIHWRPDFNEDGKPDMSLTRNCIYRLEEDGQRLVLVYGSSHTNAQIDLSDGPPELTEVTNTAGTPTEFSATDQGDLVTLVKVDAE